MGQQIGTVLGSSDNAVQAFEIGFDVYNDLVFLLGYPKGLNMTTLMDYHWEFNSNMLKMVVV